MCYQRKSKWLVGWGDNNFHRASLKWESLQQLRKGRKELKNNQRRGFIVIVFFAIILQEFIVVFVIKMRELSSIIMMKNYKKAGNSKLSAN